jgi:hypothetical protein
VTSAGSAEVERETVVTRCVVEVGAHAQESLAGVELEGGADLGVDEVGCARCTIAGRRRHGRPAVGWRRAVPAPIKLRR